MYKSNSNNATNINEHKYVYQVNCVNSKKYIGLLRVKQKISKKELINISMVLVQK